MPGMTKSTARSLIEQGADVIRRAEEELRTLLLKAVDEGDYDAVTKLNEYAKELRDVLDKAACPSTAKDATANTTLSPTEYPKFFKTNDKLTMIGWSKKGQTEYKHEAPRSILEILVSALLDRSVNRESVPIDELLPIRDPETNTEFPQYQVRLFLRWLRHIGIVTKHGHQGYSIRKTADLQSTVNAGWRRLGSRSSVY
jgi:ankyrin repeat protein